jgi:hypothetical protein
VENTAQWLATFSSQEEDQQGHNGWQRILLKSKTNTGLKLRYCHSEYLEK